jgi:hypothetical protein
MNFVAGLLLMYLSERHAFGGLVVLMQDRGLRKYYSTDMSLIQVRHVTPLSVVKLPCALQVWHPWLHRMGPCIARWLL